jgi:hypothetical protein
MPTPTRRPASPPPPPPPPPKGCQCHHRVRAAAGGPQEDQGHGGLHCTPREAGGGGGLGRPRGVLWVTLGRPSGNLGATSGRPALTGGQSLASIKALPLPPPCPVRPGAADGGGGQLLVRPAAPGIRQRHPRAAEPRAGGRVPGGRRQPVHHQGHRQPRVHDALLTGAGVWEGLGQGESSAAQAGSGRGRRRACCAAWAALLGERAPAGRPSDHRLCPRAPSRTNSQAGRLASLQIDAGAWALGRGGSALAQPCERIQVHPGSPPAWGPSADRPPSLPRPAPPRASPVRSWPTQPSSECCGGCGVGRGEGPGIGGASAIARLRAGQRLGGAAAVGDVARQVLPCLGQGPGEGGALGRGQGLPGRPTGRAAPQAGRQLPSRSSAPAAAPPGAGGWRRVGVLLRAPRRAGSAPRGPAAAQGGPRPRRGGSCQCWLRAPAVAPPGGGAGRGRVAWRRRGGAARWVRLGAGAGRRAPDGIQAGGSCWPPPPVRSGPVAAARLGAARGDGPGQWGVWLQRLASAHPSPPPPPLPPQPLQQRRPRVLRASRYRAPCPPSPL